MNLRPSFIAGVGSGIMAATVVLGWWQVYALHQDHLQVHALNDKIHTLDSQNQHLRVQVRSLEQTVFSVTAKSAGAKSPAGKASGHAQRGKANATMQKKAGQLVTVVIYPGMSIAKIADELANSRIIPAPGPFVNAAIQYNQPLRAGKFTFQVNEPFSQILNLMATN